MTNLPSLISRAHLDPNDADALRALARDLVCLGWHRDPFAVPHPDEDKALEHWQKLNEIEPKRIMDPSDGLPYFHAATYYRSRSEQRIECRLDAFVYPAPPDGKEERKPSILQRTYMCGPYQYSSYNEALEAIR